MCSIIIIFETDFLCFLLDSLITRSTFVIKALNFLIRTAYLVFACGTIFPFLVVTFHTLGILAISEVSVMHQLNQWLVPLRGDNRLLFIYGFRPKRSGSLLKTPAPDELLEIHTCIKILERMLNDALILWGPFLLCSGGIMIISSSYATIRLQSVIPMPYYLAMPSTSVVGVIVVFQCFLQLFKCMNNQYSFCKA